MFTFENFFCLFVYLCISALLPFMEFCRCYQMQISYAMHCLVVYG